MGKQIVDVMTGEPFVFTEQVMAEASSRAGRFFSGVAATATVVLGVPGGSGVPAPGAESVIVELSHDEGGPQPKLPRQRRPEVLGATALRHR